MEITRLKRLVESGKVDNRLSASCVALLGAVRDWPTDELSTLDDFKVQLESFIGAEATYQNLKAAESTVDVIQYSWQAESLTQVVESLELFSGDATLDNLMTRLETIDAA